MSTAAPTGSAPTSGNLASNNANILTEKVQRALQVRTDTPAMKAALDALAHLGESHTTTAAAAAESDETKQGDEQEDTVVVDSRSVRVAIEQDALQQALLLQGELQKLVDTIVTLRQGVTDTASIADRLSQGIHSDVTISLTRPPENPLLPPPPGKDTSESAAGGGGDDESGNNASATAATSTPVLEEAQLARTLHEAFVARDQAQQRLTVVQAFLDKFDLSEQDSRLLDHYNFEDVNVEGENPVNGMAFLKALERVVHIRKALSETFGPTAVSGDSDAQGLGASSALRMMESLAQKQEQAYERLYHWLQNYLHLYPSGNNLAPSGEAEDRLDEVLSHPFCQLALQTLQHVPAFYAHTLELIANARRSQATKQFLLALTSGHAGMPPLEMKAHDAVAYVGDMLAFCFRAFSVEADFAKGMRHVQQKSVAVGGDGDGDGDELTTAETEDETAASSSVKDELDLVPNPSLQPTITAKETLALTMSGVARPLKSRILQVVATLARSMHDDTDERDDDLESHDSMMDEMDDEGNRARGKVTQLYEICGLLLFYASAMENVEQKLDAPPGNNSSRRLLHGSFHESDEGKPKEEPSPLMKAVLDCLGEATTSYEATFRVYAAMLENLAVLSGDSEATLAHELMVGIAKCRVASPGFSDDVPCPTQFQTTLSLDWAMEVILEASLNTCKSLDDALLLQQAILKSQKAGMSENAQTLTKRVQEKESSLIDELVSKETITVLDLCGLGSMATAWKNFQEASAEGGALNSTMAAYPGLSPEEVQESMKEFYTSLYSPPLPSLETAIKDPVIRKAARRQISQRVCNFYGEIYQAVMKEHENAETGGYNDVSFLGHTPEQVVTLFSA
jgi:hypothetical protein